MKRMVAVAVAAGLAAAPIAHAAMRLDPQDLGQVLLFPYYTVQNHQSTLVGIVNTTDLPKAFNVQFREARNGNVAGELTLLLGPHDTWSVSVVSLAPGGAAHLTTSDRSCTLPYVFNAPVRIGGRAFHALENVAATTPDGGPTTPDRTREGYVQVVELGVIAPTSPLHAQLASPQGSPPAADCENLALARTDLAPPAGGAYGALGIVDAAGGTVMSGAATAIAGFSDSVVWNPAQHAFYLDQGDHGARVVGGDMATRVAQAELSVGGRTVTLSYDGLTRSRADAVSALLMADSIYGGFSAGSAWVISSPTKHRYVNSFPGQPMTPRAPYRETFGETTAGKSCDPYRVAAYDRHQASLGADTAVRSLCYSVDVLTFGPSWAGPALGSAVSQSLADYTGAGSGSLHLMPGTASDGSTGALPAALDDGAALRGLPVIGFEAVRRTGRGLTGLIAGYAHALPLRSRTSCADAAGAAVVCP